MMMIWMMMMMMMMMVMVMVMAMVMVMGVVHGRLGVLTLLKICRRARVCFDPLKCHILSLETVAL